MVRLRIVRWQRLDQVLKFLNNLKRCENSKDDGTRQKATSRNFNRYLMEMEGALKSNIGSCRYNFSTSKYVTCIRVIENYDDKRLPCKCNFLKCTPSKGV